MRKLLSIAMLVALIATLGVAASASAAPAPPKEPRAWCHDGVEVTVYTDAETNNIMQVTKTTVCEDEYTGNITYEYEVLSYWLSSKRGGRYVTPEERNAPPQHWQRPCGPSNARDVCC